MPAVLVQEFTEHVHGGKVGGHLGRDKKLFQVSQRAYWLTLQLDAKRFLKACKPCVQYHRATAPRQTKLNPLITGSPWEMLSIDITGPNTRSKNGYHFMLTVVDHFTKLAEAFPLRNHTAPQVAKTLVTQLICRFRCPKQILSDQGPEFIGQLMTELCKNFGIDNTTILS